ncbi:DUF4254 domain-containing protein [Nocardia stercoris]|uniref:DUF4254 domain-containing protein n=1 Tax=Nocardia stercoris TaxID=2483361 RepID=UPI0018F32F9D|nr:DUF4254 domain-containing protein [Nocardia stercoris]
MFRHEHRPAPADPYRRAQLPDWHQLVAAFGGHGRDRPEDHPVVRAARMLAQLHRDRRELPHRRAEIDSRRAALIAAVNHCTHSDRAVGPESPGAFLDRMAAAQVYANLLLHTTTDISDQRVHDAWHRLAALADGWTDLIAGITDDEISGARYDVGVAVRRGSGQGRWTSEKGPA